MFFLIKLYFLRILVFLVKKVTLKLFTNQYKTKDSLQNNSLKDLLNFIHVGKRNPNYTSRIKTERFSSQSVD